MLKEEISYLTDSLIELTEMDTELARQDSMMISANAKKMGRLELIYTVNQDMVKLLNENKAVSDTLTHYLQEKDKADQVYRLKKKEVEERTALLLKESFLLYNIVPEELKEKEAFKNLAHLLEEQTDHLGPKDPKDIQSNSMQNPHEPEATYRVKGKKNSVGYAMNIVEARDREKGLSMIIHYEKQPNIFSDAAFGLNAVEGLKGGTTLVSDGSFYSEAMVKKAAAKNLNLSFSALNGRPTNLEKLSSTHFTINPETELITACPNRAVPVSSKRNQKDKFYSAKLDKKTVPLVLT